MRLELTAATISASNRMGSRMAVPEWFVTVSTVVSPLLSVAGVFVSWKIYSKQKADVAARTLVMQCSLAASLLGDVDTAIAALQDVVDQCQRIPRVSVHNASVALLALRGLAAVHMPTVEAFKTQIASFEPTLADPILQASSCIERVRRIVDGFISTSPGPVEVSTAVVGFSTSAPEAMAKLEKARRALVAVIARRTTA